MLEVKNVAVHLLSNFMLPRFISIINSIHRNQTTITTTQVLRLTIFKRIFLFHRSTLSFRYRETEVAVFDLLLC